MEWIDGLQKSIDYIEDHILEAADYKKLAGFTNLSVYYYQRMFHIMTGVSVGEYIRNRRLTLAAIELSGSSEKVITIALKYGYETGESFTKAFTRFHDITPKAAKGQGNGLRAFSKMKFNLSVDGGELLDYRIENKTSFSVIAYQKQFSKEETVFRKEIPDFWSTLFKSDLYRELRSYLQSENTVTKGGILGLDEMAGCEDNLFFNYYAAVESKEIPTNPNLSSIRISAHTWAVFECTGAVPKAIQRLWIKIYRDFFPCSEYVPVADYHFELYFDGNSRCDSYKSEIWIPVKRNPCFTTKME